MKLLIIFYAFLLLVLAIYSYGFVDPNLTLSTNVFYQKLHQPLSEIVFNHRLLSTIIFTFIVFLLFIFYFLFLWLTVKKKLNFWRLKLLVGLIVGILLFAYPAFSYDIFNYIFDAKIITEHNRFIFYIKIIK